MFTPRPGRRRGLRVFRLARIVGCPRGAADAPHRTLRGCDVHARSTTFLSSPERLDAGMTLVRNEVMPVVLAMDGCLGMSTIVDRESGRCIATTAWETEDAMWASAEAVLPLRRRGAEILGNEMTVAEWEIALLHRMHNSGDGACVRC